MCTRSHRHLAAESHCWNRSLSCTRSSSFLSTGSFPSEHKHAVITKHSLNLVTPPPTLSLCSLYSKKSYQEFFAWYLQFLSSHSLLNCFQSDFFYYCSPTMLFLRALMVSSLLNPKVNSYLTQQQHLTRQTTSSSLKHFLYLSSRSSHFLGFSATSLLTFCLLFWFFFFYPTL